MTWYVMRSLIVQRHVVAYKLCVGFSCKEVKVTERQQPF